MKKANDFGQFFRVLRAKRGETLKDAAKKLGVSPSYISSVETGRRPFPKEWRKKIINSYKLTEDEINELDYSLSTLPTRLEISIQIFRETMIDLIDSLNPSPEEREKAIMDLDERIKRVFEEDDKK